MYEFKVNPGVNRTAEIVNVLLHAGKGEVLSFEKGVYDFWVDGTYREYLNPGCNKSGDKNIVFPLFNLEDVTIEGNGSTFMFHDRVFPFALKNSCNVTLKNFSVDFSFPRCMIACVKEVNSEGVRFSIDKEKYSYGVNEHGNFLINAGEDIFSTAERRYFLKQGYGGNSVNYCCFLAAGNLYYNIDTDVLPAGVLRVNAEETDDGIFFRFTSENTEEVRFCEGEEVLVSFDELRENDNFFFERCKDITLENVHIIQGAGMGFTGQCTENFTLKKCRVAPDGKIPFSTTADSVLLTNFTGLVRMEECYFENTLDDGFSIHGFYACVDRITGSNKVVLKFMHDSQSGVNFLFHGDRIHISDGVTLNEKAETAHIKSAYFMDDLHYLNVEFEEEIESFISVGDFIENPDRTPDVVIENCVFVNTVALRIGSAGKVVFKNNTVKGCSGVLINDLLHYWHASGPVRNVNIENNVMEECTFGVQMSVDRYEDTDVYHQNVHIRNNKFINCVTGIYADKTDGLLISENTFTGNGDNVVIKNCKNVRSDA